MHPCSPFLLALFFSANNKLNHGPCNFAISSLNVRHIFHPLQLVSLTYITWSLLSHSILDYHLQWTMNLLTVLCPSNCISLGMSQKFCNNNCYSTAVKSDTGNFSHHSFSPFHHPILFPQILFHVHHRLLVPTDCLHILQYLFHISCANQFLLPLPPK